MLAALGSALLDFYPRPLRGGRLGPAADYTVAGVFLSTPSARRATGCLPAGRFRQWISIHALCEEGDQSPVDSLRLLSPISIHALCEEGDADDGVDKERLGQFLSTPSARRATFLRV